MDIVSKDWMELRQNPNGLSNFCKNDEIVVGDLSLKLTKLGFTEVNIFKEGLDIASNLFTPISLPLFGQCPKCCPFFGSLPKAQS